jgi:hypothetical protein
MSVMTAFLHGRSAKGGGITRCQEARRRPARFIPVPGSEPPSGRGPVRASVRGEGTLCERSVPPAGVVDPCRSEPSRGAPDLNWQFIAS